MNNSALGSPAPGGASFGSDSLIAVMGEVIA
jgi:hypothetical protein